MNPGLPFSQSLGERRENVSHVNSLFQAMMDFSSTSNLTELPSSRTQKNLTFLRPLSSEDVDILESNGCQCGKWSNVILMFFSERGTSLIDTNLVQAAIKSQIKNCTFSGKVVLGVALSSNATDVVSALAPGIQFNTSISNSIIEPGAKVYNNSIIANTFVGSSATILNCGHLTNTKFNHLLTIDLGPEAGGGRPVKVVPESTLVDVCSSLSISRNPEDSPSWDAMEISSNIVLGELLHNSSVSNVYCSGDAKIQSSSVSNIIMLPQSSIKNSVVDSAFLQWKSAINNNSNVTSSMLMECSEIGPNSVVASTILGPDSHVSCGEVHCSVIGPNTNSHHQSLLISALWPTGRGNVGYGSNIGSNHTGRIPDQECTVGEGIFWGLGSVIKFPVDLSKSFYSVVAAGVQLPPQSVAMPFSLIMAGSKHGMNEIVPGWLLQSSPYTILRSEEKFKNRRKAKRHDFYCGWKIIRPTTVDACVKVRNMLLSAKGWNMAGGESSDSKAIFTEKDIIQLGKNYMTTRGLNVGVIAYTNLVQRYALRGLYDMFNGGASMVAIEQVYFSATKAHTIRARDDSKANAITWPPLPWEEESHNSVSKLLDHKLQVLSNELSSIAGADPSKMSFADICIKCMKKLIEVEDNHAKQVLKSKKRDDLRGEQTIPGYKDSHVQAENDPVVLLAQKRAKEVVSKCNGFILMLSENTSKL